MPVICFVNVILVCFCRFWTFGGFRHTCGQCYRSLHFAISFQFTELHQLVLAGRWSPVQAQVVTRQRVTTEAQVEVGVCLCRCLTAAGSFSWYIDFTLPIISPPLLHIHLSPKAAAEYIHRTATVSNSLALHTYKHKIISSFRDGSLVRCALYMWMPMWFDSQYCHCSESNKTRVSNLCRINIAHDLSPGTTCDT